MITKIEYQAFWEGCWHFKAKWKISVKPRVMQFPLEHKQFPEVWVKKPTSWSKDLCNNMEFILQTYPFRHPIINLTEVLDLFSCQMCMIENVSRTPDEKYCIETVWPLGHMLICNTTTKLGRSLEKTVLQNSICKSCLCTSKQSQYIIEIHFYFNIRTT